MLDSLIKKIALENGFKLKEQLNGESDLNPYVYDFAKKLLEEKQKEIEGLRMLLWFVKDHFDMNDLDKAMPRVYEKLKGATTDIIKPNHNTSCTYQFELAFHNLQDTPELRKIYWSALGQLHFNSNDRVIAPELEECPCCKAGGQ